LIPGLELCKGMTPVVDVVWPKVLTVPREIAPDVVDATVDDEASLSTVELEGAAVTVPEAV